MTRLDDRSPSATALEIPEEFFSVVVGAVRGLLQRGLPERTVRSNVRLEGFERYGGGMKSPLVGGLSVRLGLTLKIGNRELDGFVSLFRAANAGQRRVFPEIHSLIALPGDDERRVLVMDHLRGYRPLWWTVFQTGTSPRMVERAAKRCFEQIDRVHALGPESTNPVRSTPQTLYFDRLRAKVRELARLPWFEEARERGLFLEGRRGWLEAPPVDELIADLEEAIGPGPRQAEVVLHGDPHLGNLMVRRYGDGFAARLIDPNPSWGVGDYLYDVGKCFHFADDCGPARLWPERVVLPLRRHRGRPALTRPRFDPQLGTSLRRRQEALRKMLHAWRDRRAEGVGEAGDSPRWHLAVATATLVTATAVGSRDSERALTHCALSHLLQARAGLACSGP